MIEPMSRSVLDAPSRGMTAVVVLCHFPVIASEAKQSIAPQAEEWIASSLALLAMTSIGPGIDLQKLRLLRRDRIARSNAAAFDHFGIDPAIGVAEPALQGLGDGEVALGGIRIDIDGGAADDAFHHLQSHIADRQPMVDEIEFVPGRPTLDIEVGAKAKRMDRRAHHVLDGADAG